MSNNAMPLLPVIYPQYNKTQEKLHMKTPFKSHVDLDNDKRAELAQMLNKVLATTIDLRLQVKQAHCNVKGTQFFARHEMYDRLAEHLTAHSDNVAERVGTLGGYAMGTVRLSAASSALAEYDLGAVNGRDHTRCLVERFAVYCSTLRDGVKLSVEQEDPVTEDMLIAILGETELDMWFLESHLND